jgi:hypothetical protein
MEKIAIAFATPNDTSLIRFPRNFQRSRGVFYQQEGEFVQERRSWK